MRVSSEKPVDFDAILEALGARDAEPPPLMKKLLAELQSGPPTADRSSVAILAELEAWLAVLQSDRHRRT